MREFLRLDNKLFIKLKIKPLSPLTIKSAIDSDNVLSLLTTESSSIIKKDNNEEKEVIIKNGKFEQDRRKGEIYIPGSTLKGLFRNKFTEIYNSEDDIDKIFGYTNNNDENKALKSKFFIEDAYFYKEENRKNFILKI
nr:RAMP superfamily CRISPR-associated protein [Fusobacterium gastrosuis]